MKPDTQIKTKIPIRAIDFPYTYAKPFPIEIIDWNQRNNYKENTLSYPIVAPHPICLSVT